MAQVYALIAAINAYPPNPRVPQLAGCLADAENVAAYLKDRVGASLALEVLTDAQATRPAIIEQFRTHLGRAGPGDVALFHYSGHGVQAGTAPDFADYFPAATDESLLCYDSYSDGGYVLADKELAVLVQGVAAAGAEVCVTLDCCHSGSGTRDLGDEDALARSVDTIFAARPLEAYADGWYAAQKARGEPVVPPAARHILLAACDRLQTAKEDPETHSGVFTSVLLDVLAKSGGAISYSELFVRARTAARSRVAALNLQRLPNRQLGAQDPQFEPLGLFDAGRGYLGGALGEARRRYYVRKAGADWMAECGAVHGLPTSAASPASFALYPDGRSSDAAGTARAVAVGAQTSTLSLDFTADPAATYFAELTSLPAPPLLIGFSGDDASRAALNGALAVGGPGAPALAAPGAGMGYELTVAGGAASLARDGVAAFSVGLDDRWPTTVATALAHVAEWERRLALHNPRPQLDPDSVTIALDPPPGAVLAGAPPGETLLRFDGQPIPAPISAASSADQLLHVALFYFSRAFGIVCLRNDQLPPGKSMVLWGEQTSERFTLPDGVDSSIDRVKLLVSTERVDDFLLTLPPLKHTTDRDMGGGPPTPKLIANDWFAHDRTVRLVRPGAGG